MKQKKRKILFVSASGGHLEQLLMLKPLMEKYPSVVVSEKTNISNKELDYTMLQAGAKHKPVLLRMMVNFLIALFIYVKERPTHIISTGGIIGVPFVFISKITKSKIIFIETFARMNDTTRTGRFMYKHADLFIVQWKSLLEFYPEAVYGGSIY